MFPVEDDEFRITLLPEQNVVGPPAVIVGADGIGLTVITVGDEGFDVHPEEVTETVYDPPLVTVMACEVAPVDQVFPVVAEEVSVTLCPEQKVVGPLELIVGVGGMGLTVILTGVDVSGGHPA